MEYDAYAIGQRAFNIRHNKNMKQSEIGEYLGIHQATYSRFESGQYDMPMSELIKLCDYLGISISWLIGEQDNIKLTDPELFELEQYKKILINKRNKQ